MITELFGSPEFAGSCLCFPARTARETPSTRTATSKMAHILFDLEAPFAARAGCASTGCEILPSVSSTYGIIGISRQISDASVRAPLTSETGIGAPHNDFHRASAVSILRRATAQCC